MNLANLSLETGNTLKKTYVTGTNVGNVAYKCDVEKEGKLIEASVGI